MLKRIIILVCLLAVAGNAEYMTDYTYKSLGYGPWQMVEHHIYWWTPADTATVATYCDTTEGTTTVTDTLTTPWLELSNDDDAYVCLVKVTAEDTEWNLDAQDSVYAYIQSTNDTVSIDTPKSYAAGSAITDTTTLKFHAPADSFQVGSYTWGRFLRLFVIKWINVHCDTCKLASHATSDTDTKTEIEFWILGLDTQ